MTARSFGTTHPTVEITLIGTVGGMSGRAGLGTSKPHFLQLVGVTQAELDWVASESPDGAPERAQELTTRIAADNNPLLATDLSRTKSYA